MTWPKFAIYDRQKIASDNYICFCQTHFIPVLRVSSYIFAFFYVRKETDFKHIKLKRNHLIHLWTRNLISKLPLRIFLNCLSLKLFLKLIKFIMQAIAGMTYYAVTLRTHLKKRGKVF